MSNIDYTKGVFLREKVFDNGGAVINVSVDLTKFMENPINQDRYINLCIKRGKESGKLYVTNDPYWQGKSSENTKDSDIVNFSEIEEDEIPF